MPLFAAGQQAEPYQLNLRQGVTDISMQVYDLHMTILIICAVIGVVVFGAMLYSVIFHRKSKGVKPATFGRRLRSQNTA